MRLTIQRRQVLELLCEIGGCYRRDLSLYSEYVNGKYGSGTAILRSLEKEAMLNNRQIAKQHGSDKYTAVNLSNAGKWYSIHNELCGEEDLTKQRIEVSMKHFDTHDSEELQKRLLLNRISIAFHIVGVHSIPSDKPSLSCLYETMTEKLLERSDDQTRFKFTYPENLYLEATREDCERILEEGVFYTIHEVREFIENYRAGSSDTTLLSRAKGVFISDRQCYVLYSPARGENKNISISSAGEKRLLSAIEPILQFTNVSRQMPSLVSKKMTYDGKIESTPVPYNMPYAIVISDGAQMVYKLSHKYKIKLGEKDERTLAEWLTGNEDLYKKVYNVPFNAIGLDSLQYLCTTPLEDWQNEMLTVFGESPDMEITGNFADFPAVEKKTKALMTYFPVYEINTLEYIMKADYEIGMFTYSDMVETILKTVGKNILIYDIETRQRIVLVDQYAEYGKNGKYAGVTKITNTLADRELQAKMSDINALPKQYEMAPQVFFNAVNSGEIDIEEVISNLETKPLKSKYVRRSDEQIVMTCNKQLKKQVQDAARYYGASVSSYIRRLIEDRVAEDAEKYREELKKDKQNRKALV